MHACMDAHDIVNIQQCFYTTLQNYIMLVTSNYFKYNYLKEETQKRHSMGQW